MIELANCTDTLLKAVAHRGTKQIEMAQLYNLALRSSEPTDFRAINKAIVKRWSRAALQWIKRQAWTGKCFETKKGLVGPGRDGLRG